MSANIVPDIATRTLENVAVAEHFDQNAQGEALPPSETITIRATLLRAALQTAAKNDARYYLNSIFFRAHRGRIQIISTDGHKLLCLAVDSETIPAWVSDGAILSRELLAEALGIIGKICDEVVIAFGQGHKYFTVRDPNGTVSVRINAIDAKYPPVDPIIEQFGETLANKPREALDSAALNPKYLRDAGSLCATLGAASIRPFVGDEKAPVVFAFSGVDALLCIMPIHSDEKISPSTLSIIGPGLKHTLAALKARRSRLTSQANIAKNETQKSEIASRRDAIDQRIAQLTTIATPAISAA